MPEISAVNPGVDPWVPGAEKLIVLPTQFILPDAPREGIVINYGDLRLILFSQARPGTDLCHRRRPRWVRAEDGQDQDRPEEGASDLVPDRIGPARQALGRARWCRPGRTIRWATIAMYLGWPTYLIHGTNKPYGVGRRVSRGCIRMYPEGVARLYRPDRRSAPRSPRSTSWSRRAGTRVSSILRRSPTVVSSTSWRRPRRSRRAEHSPRTASLVADRAGPERTRVDWSVVEARTARQARDAGADHPAGPAACRRGGGAGDWEWRGLTNSAPAPTSGRLGGID